MLDSAQAKMTQTARPFNRPESNDDVDLRHLAGTIWRGKWIILTCAVLAMLAGGYYAVVVAVPKYAATARLSLQVRNENVVDLESVISGASTEQAAMNTEVEVIRSRGLIEKLVVDLNLISDPEFNSSLRPNPPYSIANIKAGIREFLSEPAIDDPVDPDQKIMINTVDEVLQSLAVSTMRKTYLFDIKATTESRAKSALLANRLAELYLEDQIAIKFQATENAVSWLSGRVGDLEVELKSKEDAIKELRAETALISPEALDALTRQAKDVRDRLAETRLSVAAAQDRVEQLVALQQGDDAEAVVTATGDASLKRLIARVGTQDADARKLFDSRFDLLVQREINDAERAASQIAALDVSYARLQDRIAGQTADLAELQQLDREAQAIRVLYETFLTRLKETTVQIGLQQADSRILSLATPGIYVEPRKGVILAVSLLLGAMIGTGIVLLREVMQDGFRTAGDLEDYTGHTVIGQIPRMPLRKRAALVGYLRDKPASATAEAIRNLRTSILLSDVDNPPRVILSTSSVPGEGKTTLAIALALNLSGLGKKVLLIEGDIRRRSLNEYFDANPGGSLVSVVAGTGSIEDAVVHDDQLGADIIMGDKSATNAADLFSSERFYDFIAAMRQAYDFVIIDTPPVLVVPDARIIGGLADAILYAVSWDKTSRSQVADGLRQFSSVNLGVTGLVLSQVDPGGMKRYGYGGRYGAYSNFGKEYYDA